MDKGTAHWLATKLPGCRIEQLDAPVEYGDVRSDGAAPSQEKKKRGRKPTGAAQSPAERKAAQRARQKAGQ
jgi:hypothetical protein